MRLDTKEFAFVGVIFGSVGLVWLFASVVDNNLVKTQRDLAAARQTLATIRHQIAVAQSELLRQQTDGQHKIAVTKSQLGLLKTQVDQVRQILSTTPTVIFLDNKSLGTTIFYADGREICHDHCVVAVRRGTHIQALQALTYYGPTTPYGTPPVSSFPPGAILQYLACGKTGTPGNDCGLFNASQGN